MYNIFLISQLYVFVCQFAPSQPTPTESALSSSPSNGGGGGEPPIEIFETEPPTSSGEPFVFAEGINLSCRANTTSRCQHVSWTWLRNGQVIEDFGYEVKEDKDDVSVIKSTQIFLTDWDNINSNFTCVVNCHGNRGWSSYQDSRTFLVEHNSRSKSLMILILALSLILLFLLVSRFLKSEKAI